MEVEAELNRVEVEINWVEVKACLQPPAEAGVVTSSGGL